MIFLEASNKAHKDKNVLTTTKQIEAKMPRKSVK